jgi:alpha-glucuronidase
MQKINLLLLLIFIPSFFAMAEDGHRLWLRYDPIADQELLKHYRKAITGYTIEGTSPTIRIAQKELQQGLKGLLAADIPANSSVNTDGLLVVGTPSSSKVINSLDLKNRLSTLGNEGYLIINTIYKQRKITVIAGNTDVAVLYGVFHFLRLLQTNRNIDKLDIATRPKTMIRVLNHWDNLNRTVERGYAGFSLWDWHKLPDYLSPVYSEYARANASVGINGTVLTNVNANSLILTKEYLVKVAALADVFRPYGIKVYLTARFSAPMELGKLETADPADPAVIEWWKNKAQEIYSYIPDFGGFLVKANSEGQPGPQNYGRSHADGANMLADAVKPFGGIVMWRAFVYDNNIPEDRSKQAYNEFTPLDGKFRNNVLIQVKNGPIDFQPREPFHPLFGAMPNTPLMPEFQITQEYLGFATHLVFLAPLFKECLESDTWCSGKGSEVAKIIDGSLSHYSLTGMAGVSNIGNEINWTGHPFAQSNWYAFGRLAWDPYMSSGQIADEWIRMTFTNNNGLVNTLQKMMLASRDITVSYMTPLGLHHIMGKDHHYGPGPWVNVGRPDWTSVYYHRADELGIGFDRTSSGSKATAQYAPPVGDLYESMATCPESLLLWFHHVPWDYTMKSGKTLWDELCYHYSAGVDSVKWLQQEWEKTKGIIDNDRYEQVRSLLSVQYKEAKWWRDACLLYFQKYANKPVPEELTKPEHSLEYYENLKFNFVPGI